MPWFANVPLVGPPASVAVGVVLGVESAVFVPNHVLAVTVPSAARQTITLKKPSMFDAPSPVSIPAPSEYVVPLCAHKLNSSLLVDAFHAR